MADRAWFPCAFCGDPDAVSTLNTLCRDCGIERAFAQSTCRECLRWIIREEYGGPLAAQHVPGCTLASGDDYAPRTDAEINDVMGRTDG